MDSLLELMSDVFLRNNTIDDNILKCFIDRFQENISRDDAVEGVKGCLENQIFSATKLIAQIKRDEFKKIFLEIVKEVLNKSIQQINDRLIDKIFIICNCNNKAKTLHVPNS